MRAPGFLPARRLERKLSRNVRPQSDHDETVEYKPIAWVSEIQLCVVSIAFSTMVPLSCRSAADPTCQIKMGKSLGQT
jgi:hypothetical protein